MVFSEGERKPGAPSGRTPLFASTRAHSGSTPAARASSDTTSASGSRSCQRAKQVLPNANQGMLLQLYSGVMGRAERRYTSGPRVARTRSTILEGRGRLSHASSDSSLELVL